MPAEPRQLVEQFEAVALLPAGSDERLNGYGVMGLPFKSGHVLAMRRFFSSSMGPDYTSVWHRSPAGGWTFYTDVAPSMACPRYFGAIAERSVETDITLEWLSPFRPRIAMAEPRLEWEITVGTTAATWLMNAAGRLMPDAAWRSPAVLTAMGAVAGGLLRVGRVGLHGKVPNGQYFIANPRLLWEIVDSRAQLAQEDLGPPGPVHPQASLGDFWIPQRGVLAIGQAYFEPFDPARHSSKTSCSSDEAG